MRSPAATFSSGRNSDHTAGRTWAPNRTLAWSVKKEQEPPGRPQPKARLPQDELEDKDCRAETHCSGQYGSGAVTSRQTFRRKRKAGSYLTPNTQNSI